ncbi:MAG: pssP [Caulobacteraceae bacterium]|nr:pssP [Caulobacteraceae bacterium]
MNSLLMPLSHDVPAPIGPATLRPYDTDRIDLREVLGVFLRRAWLALGVGAVLFAAVLAFVLHMTPKYTATGSVLIDPHRQNLTQAEPAQGGMPPDTSAVDTQVEVLRSHALAEAVVRQLKLYNDPEFNRDLAGRSGNIAAPSPRVVGKVTEMVQARTQVRRAGLTYVIQVDFTSRSPNMAATIANGFMNQYISRQLEGKSAAIDQANRDLGPNIERLRADAEAAQAKVQEYKTANNLLSAQGATMAEQEVSTLNDQIARAKADAAEKQARLDSALDQIRVGGGGQDVGAALGSDTVHELRKREADLSTRLAHLRTDFKSDYPDVQRTQNELNDVHAQIQLEINRVISNLRAEASAAAQRERSLLGSRGQAQGGLVQNNRAQVGLFGLQQRADAAKLIYEGYLTRAKEVAAASGLQQPDALINSAAAAPLHSSSPNMRLGLAAAAILAMIGGAVSVLVAEMWDSSLRSRQDVERNLGLPLAGALPDFRSVSGRKSRGTKPEDYIVKHPLSSFAESFRNVRAFMMLSAPDRRPRTIVITSSVPREGKSLTSLCLARTLAMAGSRVILVDCDMRQRGVTKLMGGAELGLADVVEGTATLAEAMTPDTKSSAWILPSASATSPAHHDLLGRPEADEVFQELASSFDYVILDAPPVLGVADARMLAARADQVLYVVRWNKTPRRAAQSGLDILNECGAPTIGVLLSQVNVQKQAAYGYGDSSDYFQYFRNYYIANA